MMSACTKLPLALIAAVARNGVIGDSAARGAQGLPWRLKSDLRHFKALSLGKPVIMGRRTFELIGRPLPGREIVVLTRDTGFRPAGVQVAADLDSAIALASQIGARSGAREIVVAGGAEVFAETIGQASALHITEVELAPRGDALFPQIDPAIWREVARVPQARTAEDEADFSFVDYRRRNPVTCS